MIGRVLAGVAAYRTARRFSGPRMSRSQFQQWQAARMDHWLARDLPRVGQYQGRAPTRLGDLPITDKAQVMAAFHDFNQGRITADQGWAAVQDTGRIGPISLGVSTGTSGNRTLYCVTARERAQWFGAILAKALPDLRVGRDRVAILLPQSSDLYDTARRSGLLGIRFLDLRQGLDRLTPQLRGFDPTVLVAPPRLLRLMVENGPRLTPRRVFSAAETLDPIDRPIIEAGFGVPLGQIYMASEGLFAVTCAQGTLHLAEDSTFFEFEDAGNGLVTPLISSFARRFQIMARYRMNDLLRLSPEPCPCGSPLQTVSEVVGRMDDMFRFPNGACVTPDVLRNAVLDADRGITDFRIRQIGPAQVELLLPRSCAGGTLDAARTALAAALQTGFPGVEVRAGTAHLVAPADRKLRRVEVVR